MFFSNINNNAIVNSEKSKQQQKLNEKKNDLNERINIEEKISTYNSIDKLFIHKCEIVDTLETNCKLYSFND